MILASAELHDLGENSPCYVSQTIYDILAWPLTVSTKTRIREQPREDQIVGFV